MASSSSHVPSASIRLNANAEAWIGPRRTTTPQQATSTPHNTASTSGVRPPSPFPSFVDATPERNSAAAPQQQHHRSSLNTSLSSVPVCRYYLGGGCDKGTACLYRHELSVEAPIGGGHVVFESNVANLATAAHQHSESPGGKRTPPPAPGSLPPQHQSAPGSALRGSASSSPQPPSYFGAPLAVQEPSSSNTGGNGSGGEAQMLFVARHYHYPPPRSAPSSAAGAFESTLAPSGHHYQSPQHVPRMPSPPFGPAAVPPLQVTSTPPFSRTYARPQVDGMAASAPNRYQHHHPGAAYGPSAAAVGGGAYGSSSSSGGMGLTSLPPPLQQQPPYHHHHGGNSMIFDGVRASGLRRAHAAASSAERSHHYGTAAGPHRHVGAWHYPSPPMAGMPAPNPPPPLQSSSSGNGGGSGGGALLFDGTRDGASVHTNSSNANNSRHPYTGEHHAAVLRNSGSANTAAAHSTSRNKTSQSAFAKPSIVDITSADTASVGPSSTSTNGVAPVASDSFDMPPPLSAPVIPPHASTDEDEDDRYTAADQRDSADDHQRITQLRALLEQLA